MTSEYM